MADYTLSMTAAQADAAITANVGINAAPTTASSKTVTSGGVKTYVDAVSTNLTALGAKVTKTVNGATTQNILFTKSFESSDQALSADSVTLEVAHGLGAVPFMFQGYYKCVTANNGYAIGDLVQINTINESHMVTCFADATNIGIRTQASHYVVDLDGGGHVNITSISSSWRIVFRAFL